MTTETLDRPHDNSLDRVELSDSQVQERINEIIAAENLIEAAAAQSQFAEIAKIVAEDEFDQSEINGIFKTQHEKRMKNSNHQKEILLDTMLNHPEEAFRGEFLQLEILFENRAKSYDNRNNSHVTEFCTQDHNRMTIDHIFRHEQSENGTDKFEVKTITRSFGETTPVMYTWENDELKITAPVMRHGKVDYPEVGEHMRERLLAELFLDTIKASALQLERSAEDREKNDNRARSYLKEARDKGIIPPVQVTTFH